MILDDYSRGVVRGNERIELLLCRIQPACREVESLASDEFAHA